MRNARILLPVRKMTWKKRISNVISWMFDSCLLIVPPALLVLNPLTLFYIDDPLLGIGEWNPAACGMLFVLFMIVYAASAVAKQGFRRLWKYFRERSSQRTKKICRILCRRCRMFMGDFICYFLIACLYLVSWFLWLAVIG